MAIKDLIVFFVESAIMLIPALTEAILALATGSVAGVAKAIEFGLAKLIGLVINLFAKLIGLGGLSKKVQAIFKKIRKRVDKAVNKMLKKARKAGRKLLSKLNVGKKGSAKKIKEENKKGKPEELTPQDKKLHKDINNKIVTKLEKTEKADEGLSFKDLYQKKKKEAQELEDKYQPQLKKGINLTINFNPIGSDEKDGDIDFETKIAPNTDKKKGEINTDSKVILPKSGTAYLIREHDSEGNRHFKVITSDGILYDLWWIGGKKIEIKIREPFKNTAKSNDRDVKKVIDIQKTIKDHPTNMITFKVKKDKISESEIKNLVDFYEDSEYSQGTVDCFTFARDLFNKHLLPSHVRIVSSTNDNDKNFHDAIPLGIDNK